MVLSFIHSNPMCWNYAMSHIFANINLIIISEHQVCYNGISNKLLRARSTRHAKLRFCGSFRAKCDVNSKIPFFFFPWWHFIVLPGDTVNEILGNYYGITLRPTYDIEIIFSPLSPHCCVQWIMNLNFFLWLFLQFASLPSTTSSRIAVWLLIGLLLPTNLITLT